MTDISTLQSDENAFSRLELLLGKNALELLAESRILLCGVGGVGSWTAESLIRGGIGHLTMVDFDSIKASNLNRQLPALHSTLGQQKGEILRQRLKDISPQADIQCRSIRLNQENIPPLLDSDKWDYIVDAIDERLPKQILISQAVSRNIPIISSMGSANKLLPEEIRVADISETYGCPMAKLLRKNLRKMGICSGLKVVFSPELPVILSNGGYCSENTEGIGEKRPLGTISYMPAMFGLHCTSVVIRDLLQKLPPIIRRGDGILTDSSRPDRKSP